VVVVLEEVLLLLPANEVEEDRDSRKHSMA
jgi:hypothetical protein